MRHLARKTKNPNQSRRLLTLAEIYDIGSRSDDARIGEVGLPIVRDWVVRFNTCGPDGLIDEKAPGNQPKPNDTQREALVAIVESGRILAAHRVAQNSLVRDHRPHNSPMVSQRPPPKTAPLDQDVSPRFQYNSPGSN